jgi:hypothetical protein
LTPGAQLRIVDRCPTPSVVGVTSSLEEIDALLQRTDPVDESVPAATLRAWRTELVRASVFVSYAIGVLSLDVEVLTHARPGLPEDALQSIVDDLPALLASGWVGGGWSLSPDASLSIAAAAEVASDESEGLIGLHVEVVESDLGDPVEVQALLARVNEQRLALTDRRIQLEERIRHIQEVVLHQYATGAASVNDWLA